MSTVLEVSQSYVIACFNPAQQLIAGIRYDGSVQYGEGFTTLDESAREWWKALAMEFLARGRQELARVIFPDPRKWVCAGGGGHEDGADGLRALRLTGEGLVEYLNDYRDAAVESVPAPDMKALKAENETLRRALRKGVEFMDINLSERSTQEVELLSSLRACKVWSLASARLLDKK